MALILIDVSSLIYRAYHSLSPEKFKRPSDGMANNAVYGVASMLFKILNDMRKIHKDMYPIACFDSPTCNHERQKEQSEYKANRPKCPDGLSHQFKWVRELFIAIKMTCIEIKGYEADDIIASLCEENKDNYKHIVIVSPDKDLSQMSIHDNIYIYNPRHKVMMSNKDIENKYGIDPIHFPLYQAIIGDSIDNVIGIPGIGPKTAVELIQICKGDIDNFESSKKLSKKIELIKENRDLIMSNLKIVTLNKNLGLQYEKPDRYFLDKKQTFGQFLNKMEIQSGAIWKYAKV
jgi:DNA polymerase-1